MSLQKLAKLVEAVVQWWRSPPLVKAAWAVIVAGLGIMIPGPRDLLLLMAVALANWILALLKRPPLPADSSAPWWSGLILVLLGLVILVWQSRSKSVEITVKNTPDGFSVKIKGPEDLLQKPDLNEVLRRALEERARRGPPG